MEPLTKLNPLALNLRWLMRREEPDASKWISRLAARSRTHLSLSRAGGLLMGSQPTSGEVEALASIFGLEIDDLIVAPLYNRERTILQENLAYLAESVRHGKQKEVAKMIGVSAETFSRWAGGTVKPRKRNLRTLLKLHEIDPDTDLETEPLFLSLEPVSAFAKRDWISGRVQDLPSDEIAAIYPALRKILRYDD